VTEPRGHLLGPGCPESSTALRCRVAWILHPSESLEPRGHLLGPCRPESSTALRCRVAWVLHTSESLFHVKGLALWASTGSSRRRVVVSIPYRLALCIDSGSSRRVVSAPGRPESWPRGCPRAPESLPPGSCSHGVVQLRH